MPRCARATRGSANGANPTGHHPGPARPLPSRRASAVVPTQYRIFKGDTTTQLDDEGEPAYPECWYYEPVGYDGGCLYSEALDSEEEARQMVAAEMASEEEATI